MRFSDIIGMCLDNLTRRKGRTILTVLGVFIGCTSIIVMVSIGMGMKESTDNMLKQMGDLTVVQVYQGGGGGGGSMLGGTKKGKAKLDDNAVKAFKKIQGVESVMPKLQLDSLSPNGLFGLNDRYKSESMTLVGVDTKELEKAGYKVLDGKLPVKPMEVLVGQYFAYSFMDSYMPDGMNRIDPWEYGYEENEGNDSGNGKSKVPKPYFDVLSGPITLQFLSEDEKTEKREQITVTGILKEDYAKGWETSEGIFMSIDDMKELAKKVSDKPLGTINYSGIIVKATDIKEVPAVESAIKEMGFSTSSMESIRKEMEKSARQVQLMLGGLGAISLFVAAIGITNTMIMSISERTKEIGIMKALGCFVKDIRMMFLMESAAIGLIGGILACTISFIASIGINIFSFRKNGFMEISWDLIKHAIIGGEGYTRLSVVPLALLVFSIIFSVFVGLISGYYPANKAVKITALEAIKSE